MLRTKLLDENSKGRVITELSAYGDVEAETLLMPNFKSLVTGTSKEVGVEFIDLIEELEEKVCVDF